MVQLPTVVEKVVVVEVQVALAVLTCRVPGISMESCSSGACFSQQHLCYSCLVMHQNPTLATLPFPSTAGFSPFINSPDVTLHLGVRALQWVSEEPF